MNNKILFFIICFVVCVLGITFSQESEIKIIEGTVKSLSEHEESIKEAEVQLFIRAGGLSHSDIIKSTLSDDMGRYKFELDLAEFDEISSLKLKFSAKDYHDSFLDISLDEVFGSSPSEHVVYLLPKQNEIQDLRVSSIRVSTGYTIFQKKSDSPLKFAVPQELGKLKFVMGRVNYNPEEFSRSQEIKKLEPIIRYIMIAISVRPLNPRIHPIFIDQTGYSLVRMIVPGGKSFTTNSEEINDEDRWLRTETFRVIGSILDESEKLSLPPRTRMALEKYGPLFRGYFEPVLLLDVENQGAVRHVIDKIRLEISAAETYLGPEEKAGVPMQTYDIYVEPNVGTVRIELNPPLRIFETGDSEGRDLVRFQVRLNPLTPYLHYYKMRLILLTSDNRYVATQYFEIDM